MEPSFEQIKKNLDPAFTYLVFGVKDGNGLPEDFTDLVDLLQRTECPDIHWQICREPTGERARLVVRVPPAGADAVIQKILSTGLSKDLSFFWYTNWSEE